MRDAQRNAACNFRTLWQQTADVMFPRENQIATVRAPGESKTRYLYDATAVRDSQDMASGLSSSLLIIPGQKFFALKVSNKQLAKDSEVKRYLAYLAEATVEELFASNFALQLNETLRSDVVFGTGCLFSEFDTARNILNFKDFDIAMYQILENAAGMVDCIMVSFQLTARQAKQQFGENVSEKVKDALGDVKTQNKSFDFIHYVGPRTERNTAHADSLNMPFESFYVDEQAKQKVSSGGFEEFPFAVVRWMKSSHELYGRGQGTEALPDVKMLQQMKKDLIECANRHCNPPREVLESFEGDVRVTPGALNMVAQVGSIKALDQPVLGNFPIARDIIEQQQDVIHRAFYKDVFTQFTDLKGDRRTTVEIRARMHEGLRRLALPVARLQTELFNPLISRCINLLIRHGKVAPPPPVLAGQNFVIEYLGDLALALRDQQARGFMQFAAWSGEMAQIRPDILDYIDWDDAAPFVAESMGMKIEHIASPEQVAAIRRQRARAEAAQQAAMTARVAAEGYGKTSKAAEAGSPAAEIMKAVGA